MSKSWYERKLAQPSAPRSPYPIDPAQVPAARAVQQQRVQQQQEASGSESLANGDIMSAVAAWKGGVATRTEHSSCPNCGSANYFTNLPEGQVITQQGAVRAASQCFECNYNGRYNLQG